MFCLDKNKKKILERIKKDKQRLKELEIQQSKLIGEIAKSVFGEEIEDMDRDELKSFFEKLKNTVQ